MIKDFNTITRNLRYYGGNAGKKRGFTKENGENWFLKFPKNTKSFKDINISYTTSPLSEYIGSQFYEELGFPVHETELGIYQNKVVVSCKDFVEENMIFSEMKNILNDYLEEYETEREDLVSNLEDNYYVELEELNYILETNESIKNVQGVKERFWDMFVIDSLINNSDRHNGNWGFITNEKEKKTEIAPIYDNGNSFFSKHSDLKMEEILKDENRIKNIVFTGQTPYKYKKNSVDSVKTIKNLYIGKNIEEEDKKISKEIKNAILRTVPKIDLLKFNDIIDKIPEEYKGIKIMSNTMKNFYKTIIKEKYEKILLVSLEKVKKNYSPLLKSLNKQKELESKGQGR